jgi:hypothetical protein
MCVLLLLFCGSWLASDGGLTADRPLAGVPGANCRSEPARDSYLTGHWFDVDVHKTVGWLASDGGLTADQFLPECTESKLWERACSLKRQVSR